MKTINLTVPVDLATVFEIDREILSELGLSDHIDAFESSDLATLLKDRALFAALTEIARKEVNKRLSESDFCFDEAHTDYFHNFMEELVEEVCS